MKELILKLLENYSVTLSDQEGVEGDVILDSDFEQVAIEVRNLFKLELRKFSEWTQSNTAHLNYGSIELVSLYLHESKH